MDLSIVLNRAPEALEQSVTTTSGVGLLIILTGTDPDDDSLVYTVVGNPSKGLLTGSPPSLTYTPNSGQTGPDAGSGKKADHPRSGRHRCLSRVRAQACPVRRRPPSCAG